MYSDTKYTGLGFSQSGRKSAMIAEKSEKEETVGNRIRKYRKLAGYNTQADFAEALNVSRAAVTQWETGVTKPLHENLIAISKICNIPLDVLITGTAYKNPMARPQHGFGRVDAWDESTPLGEDEVEIPLYQEVVLQDGSNQTQVATFANSGIRYTRSVLESKGVDPDKAGCCEITDNSMADLLPPGSVVLFDTDDTKIVDGKMYVLNQGGILRVRHLYRISSGVMRMKCRNAEYPDEVVESPKQDDLQILGRVFSYSAFI